MSNIPATYIGPDGVAPNVDFTVLTIRQKEDGTSVTDTVTFTDIQNAMSLYHKNLADGYSTKDYLRVSCFVINSAGTISASERADTELAYAKEE